jgi:hypothetical protein
VSGGRDTGKQAVALGRGAARYCIAGVAARSWWSKPRRYGRGELIREWVGKQRPFEKKVRAMIFYFYFYVDGSVACWAFQTSRPTNARKDKMDALLMALTTQLSQHTG